MRKHIRGSSLGVFLRLALWAPMFLGPGTRTEAAAEPPTPPTAVEMIAEHMRSKSLMKVLEAFQRAAKDLGSRLFFVSRNASGTAATGSEGALTKNFTLSADDVARFDLPAGTEIRDKSGNLIINKEIRFELFNEPAPPDSLGLNFEDLWNLNAFVEDVQTGLRFPANTVWLTIAATNPGSEGLISHVGAGDQETAEPVNRAVGFNVASANLLSASKYQSRAYNPGKYDTFLCKYTGGDEAPNGIVTLEGFGNASATRASQAGDPTGDGIVYRLQSSGNDFAGARVIAGTFRGSTGGNFSEFWVKVQGTGSKLYRALLNSDFEAKSLYFDGDGVIRLDSDPIGASWVQGQWTHVRVETELSGGGKLIRIFIDGQQVFNTMRPGAPFRGGQQVLHNVGGGNLSSTSVTAEIDGGLELYKKL